MHAARNHLKHRIFVSVCRFTLEVEHKGVFGPDSKGDWLTHRKKRAILRLKVGIVSDLQQAIRVHCFSIVPSLQKLLPSPASLDQEQSCTFAE